MKIKYLTEDGLLMLKKNKKSVYKEIIIGKKTLEDFLSDDGYLKQSPIEIEDFTLTVDAPKGKEALTDAENVKRVYGHLKGLSDSQASDERIWVALTLGSQSNYMEFRWSIKNEDEMLNRYFFNYSPQRSLFRNGMSRLWWIGRVTYDDSREDPYEFTKFMCKYQDFIESFCGRNIFNNPKVMKATIAALFDANKDGKEMTRNLIRSVGKYVNLLAGTYIIDFIEYNDIYTKVKKFVDNYIEE